MRSILLPVDFSEHSYDVLCYAAEIALQAKAEIIIYHSYYISRSLDESLDSFPRYLKQDAEEICWNFYPLISKIPAIGI